MKNTIVRLQEIKICNFKNIDNGVITFPSYRRNTFYEKRAEILGRICMDQFMVNVSQIPEVLEGDEVTLVGQDGTETITMEELGDISGRFNYELSCDLGKRIPRIFMKEGKVVAVRDYSHDSTVFFDED